MWTCWEAQQAACWWKCRRFVGNPARGLRAPGQQLWSEWPPLATKICTWSGPGRRLREPQEPAATATDGLDGDALDDKHKTKWTVKAAIAPSHTRVHTHTHTRTHTDQDASICKQQDWYICCLRFPTAYILKVVYIKNTDRILMNLFTQTHTNTALCACS